MSHFLNLTSIAIDLKNRFLKFYALHPKLSIFLLYPEWSKKNDVEKQKISAQGQMKNTATLCNQNITLFYKCIETSEAILEKCK